MSGMKGGQGPREESPSPVEFDYEALAAFGRRIRPILYPLTLALLTTFITLAFGVCAFLGLENRIPEEGWLAIWNRWDAPHFQDVAQNGYPDQVGPREFLIAYLPVFPLAIWVVRWIFRDWHLAAFLLSNVCCAAAFVYFFLLNRLEYDRRTARWAVLFLATFPTAYFLHAAYSESLFLLCTVAAFYHARRGQWLLCGILGMLATGTRIPGLAIVPPLTLEYLYQRNFRWRKIRWDFAFLALIPLGILAYFFINYHYFGDALHFLGPQRKVWGAFLRSPFPEASANWYGVWHAKPSERVLQYGGPLVAFVIATGCVLVAPFKLRPCYALYLAFSWVLIFSNNYPVCSPRYLLPVFPLFMLIARLCRQHWLRDAVVFMSVMFYALCTLHYVRGWWTF
ncbi:MAG: mannosyltransferase family protein [Verrucomicrobiota bacterium]